MDVLFILYGVALFFVLAPRLFITLPYSKSTQVIVHSILYIVILGLSLIIRRKEFSKPTISIIPSPDTEEEEEEEEVASIQPVDPPREDNVIYKYPIYNPTTGMYEPR